MKPNLLMICHYDFIVHLWEPDKSQMKEWDKKNQNKTQEGIRCWQYLHDYIFILVHLCCIHIKVLWTVKYNVW